jgi:uncharacterized protein
MHLKEKPMRRTIKTVQTLALLLALSACVTVNIYFPAAQVERTAEQIVDDVYGKSAGEQSFLERTGALHLLAGLLAPSTAHAQEATTVSNSAIRGLKEQISGRHQELLPFYGSGNVGITREGYLEVLETKGLSLQQVAALKRLVQADNNDRQKLYAEVAKALNLDPGQVKKVEEIFARQWQDKAGSGWPIQNADGKWTGK